MGEAHVKSIWTSFSHMRKPSLAGSPADARKGHYTTSAPVCKGGALRRSREEPAPEKSGAGTHPPAPVREGDSTAETSESAEGTMSGVRAPTPSPSTGPRRERGLRNGLPPRE